MLAGLCSKSFKLGFSSTWTENFRCISWVLKRQRNQRWNCQHSLAYGESKGVLENSYFYFTDYAKFFDYVNHNKLWKILKEIGIPGHLTCLLRNLYAGQVATVRTRHVTTDWFQIGKGVRQGCILSPCFWHHPYGRKRRRTKEPLDESERGEGKNWLKVQHSEN